MDASNTSLTGQINSLGHTFTFGNPAGFSATSLSGFNTVWLDGFSNYGNDGTLNAKLTSFLTGGGTVLVQSPGFGTESLSSYPLGATLAANYTYPPGENFIRIVNAGHALNAGLTQVGLAGWNPSAAGVFTANGAFTVLADNGVGTETISLVQSVGAGTLVYTQLGISQRLANASDPVALQFLDNVIRTSVPEPATVGLLMLGAGAVFGAGRRRA